MLSVDWRFRIHPAHPGKATNTLRVERGHVLSNLYLEQFSSELYVCVCVCVCVSVCVCVTVLWGWQPESRFIGASFRQLRETGVDLMFSLLTLSGGKEVVKMGAWVRCLFRWRPLEGSCSRSGSCRALWCSAVPQEIFPGLCSAAHVWGAAGTAGPQCWAQRGSRA